METEQRTEAELLAEFETAKRRRVRRNLTWAAGLLLAFSIAGWIVIATSRAPKQDDEIIDHDAYSGTTIVKQHPIGQGYFYFIGAVAIASLIGLVCGAAAWRAWREKPGNGAARPRWKFLDDDHPT